MSGPTTRPERKRTELEIEGMTCASCVARVEKQLNQLDGASATVNFATERATVDYDADRLAPEDLVHAIDEIGYGASLPAPETAPTSDGPRQSEDVDDRHAAGLRRRLLAAAALSVPILIVSMIPALQFDYWQWLALLLATPVVFWAGWPFHNAAWKNLRRRAATMDTLISLGTLAAWGWSVVALVFLGAGEPGISMPFDLLIDRGAGADQVYFEVAAVITTFLLAGRYFEARAKRRAGAALRALLELGAKEVSALDDDGTERRVPIAELMVGDRFIVRSGERVPTDGIVEEGTSAIDQSVVTGESVPVEVGPGVEVVGASVNAGGRLIIRATRVGDDTALAQIARLVEEAQSGKAPVQRLADRISAVFVPIVIVLALATLAFWLANGSGSTFSFSAAIAVLIVACPCALGLATPTALLVGTGRGAQLGIVIKGPEMLESTRRIDMIVLDKTGTVTTGEMSLVGVAVTNGTDPDEVLRLAGSLEDSSEHPIAKAIAAAARELGGSLPRAESARSHEGLGVEGVVEGRRVVVGRPALLADRGLRLGATLDRARIEAEEGGRTAVAVAWDGEARAVLALADTPKPTSAEAIAHFRTLGLRTLMLTGDNRVTARSVGAAVGVDEVVAEVMPAGKAEMISNLQDRGHVVAMVGDGVNDAPALAQADLGLAIGTGTEVAIEASDLTLVSGDLRSAADAIRLSRRTLGTIKGNLFWAFAYNVAAIPLAALGFLSPILSGGAMAFSSVFVVSNSLRLRSFRSVRSGRRNVA